MITIKKPTLCMCLFVLFNITYLIYRAGIFPQIIYYGTLILFCLYSVIYILRNRSSVPVRELNFIYGIRNLGIIILSFWLISTITQLINNNFQLYLYTSLVDLIFPILVAFCILNIDCDNVHSYFSIFFIRTFLQFLIEEGSDLSWNAILSVDWFNSSSIVESSNAHAFCLFVIYFLYRKKYFWAILSTFFCFIALKRIALVYCLLSWVIFRFIPNRRMGKISYYSIGIIFCLSPLLLNWIYSGEGNVFFNNTFGIDFYDFSQSRNVLVLDTLNHFNSNYNGFGTIPNYFESRGEYWAGVNSFHCDMLRLYLECTMLGVIIYIFSMMGITKRNWKSFYVLLYLFIELIVSHFLGCFVEWTFFYLFSYLINDCNDKKVSKKGNHEYLYKHSYSCI